MAYDLNMTQVIMKVRSRSRNKENYIGNNHIFIYNALIKLAIL